VGPAASNPAAGAPGRRDKAILLAGMVSDRIGMALLYVVFGPLAREVGLSEVQFGVLIAAANVTLGFASPWWGRRSQALGRRPVFVIGLCGYACGFLLLGLALQAGLAGRIGPEPLFLLLLAVRLGYGLVAAATQPAATAWLADATAAHARTQGMALIGVAAGIGTILGPIVGGGLALAGAVVPLYVAAGIAVAAAALAQAGLREAPRRAPAGGEVRLRFADPRVLPYLAGWCLIVLVITGIQTITVFYVQDELGLVGRAAVTRATSIALLAMGVTMVVAQAGILQAFRIAPPTLLRAGFALTALALLVLLAARSLAGLYGAYALIGLGFSALGPGLNAAASLGVSDREQGAVAGLLAAAPVLGMIAGPLLASFLYGANPAWPMALGAAACAGMAAYFMRRG
jgi:MFS family permease